METLIRSWLYISTGKHHDPAQPATIISFVFSLNFALFIFFKKKKHIYFPLSSCATYGEMDVFGDNSCPSPCNTLGFLQKNNSLDDKGRLSGQKNLLSCNNGDRDSRFRLTETDFSNLFARGENLLHTWRG